MEKPEVVHIEIRSNTKCKAIYGRYYNADEIDAWIDQEMARKVELDEEKVLKIINDMHAGCCECWDSPTEEELAQAICSISGELIKGE